MFVVNTLVARAMLVGGLVLAGMVAGAYVTHSIDTKKFDKLNAEYNQFKGGVKTAGNEQNRRAAMADATNLRNKERADEENRKRAAAVAADIRRLRDERDSARRSFLSSAPAGSVCPDDQICLKRADYIRAYGELVREVRSLSDEGTAVTNDLDTVKNWANGK